MKVHYLNSKAIVQLLKDAFTAQDPCLLKDAYEKIKGTEHAEKELNKDYPAKIASAIATVYHVFAVYSQQHEKAIERNMAKIQEAIDELAASHNTIPEGEVCPNCTIVALTTFALNVLEEGIALSQPFGGFAVLMLGRSFAE